MYLDNIVFRLQMNRHDDFRYTPFFDYLQIFAGINAK